MTHSITVRLPHDVPSEVVDKIQVTTDDPPSRCYYLEGLQRTDLAVFLTFTYVGDR